MNNTQTLACVWGVSFNLLAFVISFEILSCLHNRFSYSIVYMSLSQGNGREVKKCVKVFVFKHSILFEMRCQV